MKKRMSIAAGMILLFFCLALPGMAKDAKAFTFTDDIGREVVVDHPERVVTTIGSYAKIWMLAGGEETIVAASNDAWEEFDLELPDTAVNLGKTKKLNMELLLQAEPDFVLASGNTEAGLSRQELYEDAGLNAAYFTVNFFEDYLRMLKICTEITGREDLYEKYGTEVAKEVEEARKMDDGSCPGVLYVRISGKGLSVKSSEGTILGGMLRDLGADNLADREEALLENLNMEVILEADPEYIFLVRQVGDAEAIDQVYRTQLEENPIWNSLTAVREGRVHVMDSSLYNLKPCERWGEAYLKLAEILYEKD